MLNPKTSCHRHRQDGLVLVIALIVLVLVSLGGLALMRSVDTTTLVAGNIAFQQAATRTSDIGVEAAISKLEEVAASSTTALDTTQISYGYVANTTSIDSPAAGQTWQSLWKDRLKDSAYTVTSDDGFGNEVQYVIHRLCANALPPTSGGQCVYSPTNTVATGNGEEAGGIQLQGGSSKVYYRITVRVAGPRRTESYVQAHVAM